MKQHVRKRIAGFTLFEIMVVISIIAMLSSVIMVAVMNARKDARDKIRIASVEQIKLGVRLDKEKNGSYLDYGGAARKEIGVGNPIDALGELGGVMAKVPRDPLSTGAGNAYGYWYDSGFYCTTEPASNNPQRAVLVKKLEVPSKSNFDAVCGSGTSNLPIGWIRSEVYITLVQ